MKKLLSDYAVLINDKINEYFPNKDCDYKVVLDAARYSLIDGGKRIRPIIMLEFAKLCGGNEDDVLPFAVALEMIHTYSLIHDDLPCMDNDDMRRGKLSCHRKYGENIALLAGDTLLTEAFTVAAKSNAKAENVVKAIEVLAQNAGLHGMIGGQVLDLSFEKNPPQATALRDMCLRKTGALLLSAAKIGCILSDADDETINIASNYALSVGLAFQIIDDILDITGDEKSLGKPIGSDAQNRKTTFVTLYGFEGARVLAEELTQQSLAFLKQLKGNTDNLEIITKFLLNRNY